MLAGVKQQLPQLFVLVIVQLLPSPELALPQKAQFCPNGLPVDKIAEGKNRFF
jgi:hypothetical protein